MKTHAKICDVCGKDFIAKRPHARFCGQECRFDFWVTEKNAKTNTRMKELEDENTILKERLLKYENIDADAAPTTKPKPPRVRSSKTKEALP